MTPQPTATPVPTAASTPTAAPTPTPVPTPTPKPTVKPIPASKAPVTIGTFKMKLTEVKTSDNGMNGWVPANKTADQTVLVIQATWISGGTFGQFLALSPSVTDETGAVFYMGSGLSIESEKAGIWMYNVPKTSSKFLWRFQSGEVIDLSPMM